MANESESPDSETRFEKVVKEFGNAGHVTLPNEYVGEEVLVTTVEDDQPDAAPPQISPPITIEKLKSILSNSDYSDFTFGKMEQGEFPREGSFEYRHDVRLSINVELGYETGAILPDKEEGVIIYSFSDLTDEEIQQHCDWSVEQHNSEVVYGVEPSVDHLFDHPSPGYCDVYEYQVQWNDSTIRTVRFDNRTVKNGTFYRPVWGKFSSLTEYRRSLDYTLAVAISEASQEEYDTYLDSLNLDHTVWGDKEGQKLDRDLDREEALENMVLYHP